MEAKEEGRQSQSGRAASGSPLPEEPILEVSERPSFCLVSFFEHAQLCVHHSSPVECSRMRQAATLKHTYTLLCTLEPYKSAHSHSHAHSNTSRSRTKSSTHPCQRPTTPALKHGRMSHTHIPCFVTGSRAASTLVPPSNHSQESPRGTAGTGDDDRLPHLCKNIHAGECCLSVCLFVYGCD